MLLFTHLNVIFESPELQPSIKTPSIHRKMKGLLILCNKIGSVGWYTAPTIHRGSYMSAPVLLNLSNKLEKSNKMQGLLSILLLFLKEFTGLIKPGGIFIE